MNIEQLRKEIRKTTWTDEDVNIAVVPYAEERFNLVRRPEDGKWEIFYAERGHKNDLRVFDTEEEAADEMMKLAQEHASLRWGIRLKEFFRKWKDHDYYNSRS